MTTSILPPNATTAERAIDDAIANRMPDPSVIANLFNPELCPESHLPWLAWALSVEDWNADWPVATKRLAIRQSIQIHEILGTRGAVERAIARVWGNADLHEWFDYGGAPYHFTVDLYIDREGFDVATASDLDRVIAESTNVRSVLDAIRMFLASHGSWHIAAATCGGEAVTLSPYLVTQIEQGGGMHYALGIQSVATTTIYPAGGI